MHPWARPTLRQQDNLAGVNRFLSQTSVSLRPYANRRPRGHPRFNTGDRFRSRPRRTAHDCNGDLCEVTVNDVNVRPRNGTHERDT